MLDYTKEHVQVLEATAGEPTSRDNNSDHNSENQPAEQEFLTVTTKNARVRKTTSILAIVFILGLAGLWFMIRKTSTADENPVNNNDQQAQIEKVIAQLIGTKSETFSSLDKTVDRFYKFRDVPQIETDQLIKNPFKTERLLGDLTLGSTFDKSSENQKNADVTAMQAAANLQLLSIMETTNGNCCMINDQILYEGDSIAGFNISQISNGFVTLSMPAHENDSQDDTDKGAEIKLVLKLVE